MNRFLLRLAMSLIAVLIAMLAALIAVGYFTIALFLFLLQMVAAPIAALGTGVGVLLIAAAIIIALRMAMGAAKPPVPRNTADGAAELGGVLGRKLHDYATTHKGPAAIAALAVGFAIGVSPKLRNFLRDVLKV